MIDDFCLRLSFAENATACFDFEFAFLASDFEILQFFWGIIVWFFSALVSKRIVESFSGWKDSVVYFWFRRRSRKPPDKYGSFVSQFARSLWLLSVPSQDCPATIWLLSKSGILCLNFPSIHQVYFQSKSIPDAHPIKQSDQQALTTATGSTLQTFDSSWHRRSIRRAMFVFSKFEHPTRENLPNFQNKNWL